MAHPVNPSLRRASRFLHIPLTAAHLAVCAGRGSKICLRAALCRRAGLLPDSGLQVVCLSRQQAWLLAYPPSMGCPQSSRLRLESSSGAWYFHSATAKRMLQWVSGDQSSPRFRFLGPPRQLSSGLIAWRINCRPVTDVRSLSSKYTTSKG